MATHFSIIGRSHGQRSLVGYNQWGLKELNTTEHSCTQSPVLKKIKNKKGQKAHEKMLNIANYQRNASI